MPTIRRLAAREWRAYRDLRLRALADAPDAFGTTLDAARRHSDAHWTERVSAGAGSVRELPLVAEDGGRLAGMVWATIDPAAPETAHVIQMWVAPESRGHRCGWMLLDAVVGWARDAGARTVLLRVTCGDSPARRLYSRAGFEPVGEPEPIRPGSALLAQPMCLEL